MKALLTTLALSIVMLANASDPNFAMSAKAKNMADVMKEISYPKLAQQNATEGKVLVILMVNELGEVTESKVVSYPCAELKAEVEKAVAGLRFEPAKDASGQNIASVVRLPFEFTLNID